jgi:nicotinamide-nucleotide amidase
MLTLRFHTFGLGESTLQQWINDQIPELTTEVELGFRAGVPTLEVKLSSPAASIERLHHYRTKLKSLIGDYIVAEGGDCLAQTLINRLKALGKRVTTAESCTGGLIASMLTRQAGASAVFEAGFVTYADTIKARVLGVSPATLATQGAVSESVVREMAQGALQASGADYAIAVSGIAGPDGGTPEKPAGTAWVAWGDHQRIETACLYYPYDRTLFQTMIAGASLDLLRRFTSGITSPPRYLKERRPPEGR